MTRETYIKMTQPFRDNAGLAKSIHILNKSFTGIVFLSYPLLLLYIFVNSGKIITAELIVPAIGFVLLSGFRYLVNRPRPYEKFGVAPVIAKDTRGKSFPSRHVFSACIISVMFLCNGIFFEIGIVLLVITAAMAVIRVVSGVHFISDVIAGIICGLLLGEIGFLLCSRFIF